MLALAPKFPLRTVEMADCTQNRREALPELYQQLSDRFQRRFLDYRDEARLSGWRRDLELSTAYQRYRGRRRRRQDTLHQPSFKNTLSAGDRTTLALAFFLAHLERDPAAKDTIVVFDDPFNSQDSFRRRQTVHEIIKVADRCLQIVVLSHDATFLKQLWAKAPPSDRVCVGISDHRSLGSKFSELSLDRATQGRTATDIDDLQTYVTNGSGALIDVVRKMRVVLETYCRTTYPSSFQPNEWLGEMVGKIRVGGDSHPAAALYSELDQINDYTSQYHHGEDMEDVTPDQIDPNELTGYARRTLRIVNALQA